MAMGKSAAESMTNGRVNSSVPDALSASTTSSCHRSSSALWSNECAPSTSPTTGTAPPGSGMRTTTWRSSRAVSSSSYSQLTIVLSAPGDGQQLTASGSSESSLDERRHLTTPSAVPTGKPRAAFLACTTPSAANAALSTLGCVLNCSGAPSSLPRVTMRSRSNAASRTVSRSSPVTSSDCTPPSLLSAADTRSSTATCTASCLTCGSAAAALSGALAAAAALPQVKQEAVHVAVEERVSAALNNDGGVQSLDVTGELRLTVRDAAFDRLRIVTRGKDDGAPLQFKTHPNVDKAAFAADGVVQAKNAARGFPVGTALGVVKWRLSSKDDSLLPLAVSCWPSPGADNTIVNCEYELLDTARELRQVVVRIPLPGGAVPVVGDVDGAHSFDHKAELLLWQLDVVDADSASGTLEFTLPFVIDSAALFPIAISFASTSTFAQIAVDSMHVLDSDDAPVKFSEQRTLLVDRYTVEQ
eukprot:TRINITY_DN524_c0_g1_i3.p1 TRINITY_DN524_c0_g1~~TRINITY_DN524_c0_g1_i3.p1  ORF type:complete len:472 (+),score=271.90 TRINITY_DN524_c0_g1_i3:212-1627(+)